MRANPQQTSEMHSRFNVKKMKEKAPSQFAEFRAILGSLVVSDLGSGYEYHAFPSSEWGADALCVSPGIRGVTSRKLAGDGRRRHPWKDVRPSEHGDAAGREGRVMYAGNATTATSNEEGPDFSMFASMPAQEWLPKGRGVASMAPLFSSFLWGWSPCLGSPVTWLSLGGQTSPSKSC